MIGSFHWPPPLCQWRIFTVSPRHFHLIPDFYLVLIVAKQVANHTYAPGIRSLHVKSFFVLFVSPANAGIQRK
jgi:hypothetical protein